ncbi:hypothetical protein AYM40_07230 [Paraburkholderia phytofirmans OLGA172]|uniref:DUF4148 domain-containing protein n=1 Tax=Paraburkholderia phytofirmans OLGA172 TaxID=1417228 RepID=A0A160FIR1_9BURK|nr:DUF4148 domain-containing protein [Paraburkholderia phytofirmans]ANB72179.1 hypothetical protein AYM40_07230 [Paraburkholderia phytofirmans OLGA172]
MKSLIQAVVVAAVLAAPVVSFAQQSNAPVTRAQVQAELVQLEKAGWNARDSEIHYPQAIQAAEARVAAQNDATGVGSAAGGSSQSGRAVSAPDLNATSSRP